MLPASLPPAGKVAPVNGIPFVFDGSNAEGNDHIDVGQSLFRQGNAFGYFPSFEYAYRGSAWRDPARIQLRLPNGQYDSLYVLAASDGERDSVPLVSAMFFRPHSGFAKSLRPPYHWPRRKARWGGAFPSR